MDKKLLVRGPTNTSNAYSTYMNRRSSIPLLNNIVNDLVECVHGYGFMKRLFSCTAGLWQDVLPLCTEEEDVHWALQQLERKKDWPLRVTWLDYPKSLNGEDYSIIVFYFDPEVFGRSIIFRRKSITGQALESTAD